MNDRVELTFRMPVRQVFRFGDGRTVFVGTVDQGEDAILLPGKCELVIDGNVTQIEIQPEMMEDAQPAHRHEHLRAVATTNLVNLQSPDCPDGHIILQGKMRMIGHRDLVGIESPPRDFVPDRMTLGPRLPDGWDGDAWTSPDESRYFLRAWNKGTARYAIGTGGRYEDAREMLRREIEQGGRPVEITVRTAV